MEKLLDLEQEIKRGQKEAKKAKELYQLLSSYNAYIILLMKANKEYKEENACFNQYYFDSDCYKKQIADLFGLFKTDEYIIAKKLSGNNKDMLFLIDQDTLLKLTSFDITNSNIAGLSYIGYDFLKINNCKARVYNQSVYHRDPYYCEAYYEDKDAFGLFNNDRLVTPNYALNSQFRSYDNMDIRDILKIQSLDEIYEKITEAKNTKAKKLVLTK